MANVFNQKRQLGLIKCKNPLAGFSDEKPILLLMMVNHDPSKTRLRQLVRDLPESRYADVRVGTSSLMGYGLYEPTILAPDDAVARLG